MTASRSFKYRNYTDEDRYEADEGGEFDEWIRRLGLDSGITIEERVGEIVVAPKNAPKKLSWEETASEMAADDEDWSDWERMPDGWSPE